MSSGPTESVIPGVAIKTKMCDGIRTFCQVAVCHCCGAERHFNRGGHKPLPEQVIFKRLRHNGWIPHRKGNHLCKQCVDAQKTKETPDMPKDLTTQSQPAPEMAAAKRRPAEHVKAPAIAIKRLVEIVGVPAAADMLGLSQPPLRDAIRDGEWKKVHERAAESALREIEDDLVIPAVDEGEPLHLVLGKVPAAEVERIVNGAAFLGVELMDLGRL